MHSLLSRRRFLMLPVSIAAPRLVPSTTPLPVRLHNDRLVRMLLDIEDPAYVDYAHDLAAAHVRLVRTAAQVGEEDTAFMKRDIIACNAVLRDRFIERSQA